MHGKIIWILHAWKLRGMHTSHLGKETCNSCNAVKVYRCAGQANSPYSVLQWTPFCLISPWNIKCIHPSFVILCLYHVWEGSTPWICFAQTCIVLPNEEIDHFKIFMWCTIYPKSVINTTKHLFGRNTQEISIAQQLSHLPFSSLKDS